MCKRLKYFLALGILVSCSSCARFEPKPISPAQTATALENRTLDDPGLKNFLEKNLHHEPGNWPATQWNFEMLTLAAFYFHPDLDVARAQWNVAQAGVKTAGGVPNPTLSLVPGYDTTHNAGLSPWFPAVSFDLPVETAGKRGKRIAQAEYLSESARLNIAVTAWQVRSRLRRSLVDFYAAREAEGLLQQQQQTQAEVVRLLEAQLSAGAVSPFEVTQARIALDNTRLALGDAERQRGEAHAQVASALGLPASALDDTVLSFAGLAQPPTAGLQSPELRRQALWNRADILSALAEYAAAESALRLEIARQYPDVHLSPGYQFDQRDNKWSLGITFELPVLNQNQGPIIEAKAKREEAAAHFLSVQAKAIGDVDRAAAAYSGALTKVAMADTLLANLKKQERTTQARLDAGDISRLELSAVQVELSQSALIRLDALVKAQQTFGDLEDALQSPLDLPDSVWQTSPRISETSKTNKHP